MSDEQKQTEENLIPVEGIFEKTVQKPTGVLLPLNRYGRARSDDTFVPKEIMRGLKLKTGMLIKGVAIQNDRFPAPRLKTVETIDGQDPKDRKTSFPFDQLTSIPPEEQLQIETKDGSMGGRVIDLFCPIGKGTRGLIVAPPRTGKTTILQNIAEGIIKNHPDVHVMVLLVDERPEEVTDFSRNINAEVFASSNDESLKNHIRVSTIAMDRAKNLVEGGRDVVLLIDSITRLSRAYNSSRKGSGRTMSGGLDARALEGPRKLFSAARNTEEGGSLTIIASALIETGSRMDDLIFQEFKGTGNMEMVLSRKIAELRIWPAVDINASGTRREELILSNQVFDKVSFFRRAIASLGTVEAAETTIDRMSTTKDNDAFLRLLSS